VGEGSTRPSARSRLGWLVALVAVLASGALVSPLAPALASVPHSQSHGGTVPPNNPPKSLPPDPNYQDDGACGSGGPNSSTTCIDRILSAIDGARKTEPVKDMTFDLSAYRKLTPAEQLFVSADLERTARGLQPIEGLTRQLDTYAEKGAKAGTDPTLPFGPTGFALDGGGTAASYGGNWAGGAFNALGSDYGWMYDDGPNSPNADCPHPGASGCWGHRDNILSNPKAGPWDQPSACSGVPAHLVMGAGSAKSTTGWNPSQTELFVLDCGPAPPEYFTWTQARKLLFPKG